MSLEDTLKELEDELEKKQVEVIHLKSRINTRLEEQHAVESELTEHIRVAIAEERRKSDRARHAASDHNSIRLMQINMEMEVMTSKVEDLSAREQLGAAGLVRLSSTLTNLEAGAKKQLVAEMQPLVAAAHQLLGDTKRNSARLVPILGESEAAAAAERSLASLITVERRDGDVTKQILNGSGVGASPVRGTIAESVFELPEDDPELQKPSPTFIGGPMDFNSIQRESCASSIAVFQGAASTKKAIVDFAKEARLEFQLFAGVFRRESERKAKMQEEINAQTEVLEAAQVVAKDLADNLLASQSKLYTINKRVRDLTDAVNADSTSTLDATIDDIRQAVKGREMQTRELANKVRTAKSDLDDAKQALKKAITATESAASERARAEQKKSEYEQQLDKIAADASNSKQRMHSTEDKLQQLENQKIRLLKSVGDAELAEEAAHDKFKSKESELADIESRLRIANTTATSREDLLGPLKRKLNEAQGDLESTRKEVTALELGQTSTAASVEALTRHLTGQKAANVDKQREIEYVQTIIAARATSTSASTTPGSEGLRPLASMPNGVVLKQQLPTQRGISTASGSALQVPNSGARPLQDSRRSEGSASEQQFLIPTFDRLNELSQQTGGSRRPSGAEAYLQNLHGSPELVRSSKSPSVATDSGAAVAGYQPATSTAAPPPPASQRPQRRDLTEEYGFGGFSNTGGASTTHQQQREALSAMDRLKQRYSGNAVANGDVAGNWANPSGGPAPVAASAAPSMANINSRLSAILERKNKRAGGGGFY